MVADVIREAAQRYGMDPAVMLRMAEIESNLNPAAANKSGARGLFQFMPPTAVQYGLHNPLDPAASSDAAMRLARDNGAHFQKQFGRAPSGAETYLMHQQGAGGASKLLSQPDAPAESLVGRQAVLQNGGRDGMTAREFADLWLNKFDRSKSDPGRVYIPPGTTDSSNANETAGVKGRGADAVYIPPAEGLTDILALAAQTFQKPKQRDRREPGRPTILS